MKKLLLLALLPLLVAANPAVIFGPNSTSFNLQDALKSNKFLVVGTAGAGYVDFVTTASTGATPAAGHTQILGVTDGLAIFGENGFFSALSNTQLTASRVLYLPPTPGALGNIVGSDVAATTDNAVVRWDGITGRIVQNSAASVSDAGLLSSTSMAIPTFTAGSVIFAATSGVFTQDNANFFFNNAANRLGLGDISPDAHLDIQGSVDEIHLLVTANGTQTNNIATFEQSGGTDILNVSNTQVVIPAMTLGSALFAGTGGAVSQDNSNYFWDDTNNRLGLGIAVPLQQLHLTGNIRFPATSIMYADADTFIHRGNGTEVTNTFVGVGAGPNPIAAVGFITGVGYQSLTAAVGNFTSAFGTQSGILSTGDNNTFIGAKAGFLARGQTGMTHVGREASNATTSTGTDSVAVGLFATTSTEGVSIGESTGGALSTGVNNTLTGRRSGLILTTGSNNSYYGHSSNGGSNNLTYSGCFGAGCLVSQSSAIVLGGGSSEDVSIGDPTPDAHFDVQGADDEIQTRITANGTQTANILQIESSAPADLVVVQGDGAVVISEAGGNGGNVVHGFTRRTSTSAASATCSVNCNAGEIAMGGGCNNTLALAMQKNFPTDNDTWSCEFALATGDCTAYAMCAQY